MGLLGTGTTGRHEISCVAAITPIVIAAAVGVIFGDHPVRRASRLDPIEAHGYE